MTAPEQVQPRTRRVRPWIAALLTFLGWGLGFYYARQTKAAIRWAFAPFVLSLLIAFAFWIYLLVFRSIPGFFGALQPWMIDVFNVGSSALVAIVAWIAVSRQREVEPGSPVRLLGYLGIWLLPLLAALVLASGLRFFYMQPFRIPSGNMEPTLHVGDFVVVSKSSYGFGPYSTAPLVGLIQRDSTSTRRPERGDIAVFRPPSEPDRDFVKRVVGLPGDRLQMIDGVLNINGVAVNLEPVGTLEVEIYRGSADVAQAYRETLPNGVNYTVLDMGESELDNTRVFVVPAEHYFMMGDHRDNSADSRLMSMVGYVPIENFVGRVDHILRSDGAGR